MALYNEPFDDSYGGYQMMNDPYPQGVPLEGNASQSMPGMASGAPSGIPIADLALKAVGTGFDVYGKYKQRQDADRRYKDQLKAFEAREMERQADKALEAQRRDRQEGYFASDFNQDMKPFFS